MPQLRRRGLPAPSVVRGVHVARRRGAPPRTSRDAVDVDRAGFPPKSPPYPGTAGDFVPYGVGYVELPGQVRVEARLTESDPAKLRIGMEMELVLVPGSGRRRRGDLRVPARGGRGRSTNDGVAIVGIGMHEFGRNHGVSGIEQGVVAARAALADAGIGGPTCSSPWADRTRRARRHDGVGARPDRPAVHQRRATAARPAAARSPPPRQRDRLRRGRRRHGGRLRQAPARRVQPAPERLGPAATGTARPASCSPRSSSG